MPVSDHPDAVARLRLALWGDAEPAALDAQLHARACPECGFEILELRRVRDAMRRVYGPEPSPAVRGIVRDASAGPDLSWLPAVPVGTFAGVRGPGGPPLLRCDDGDVRVDAMLVPSAPGRTSVSGQVTLDSREPAADLDVTLFLDRRPAGTARTDRFGEFSADVRDAARIGVAVEARGRRRLVELRSPEVTR